MVILVVVINDSDGRYFGGDVDEACSDDSRGNVTWCPVMLAVLSGGNYCSARSAIIYIAS
jgi:hypothetical protein